MEEGKNSQNDVVRVHLLRPSLIENPKPIRTVDMLNKGR